MTSRPTTTRKPSPGKRIHAEARLRTIGSVEQGVVVCDRCPGLREYCARIAAEKRRAYRDEEYWGRPVPGFGDPRARLLIVGLAPAAHGGNRTGRMFTGDSSGDWLYGALHRVGLANRSDSTGRDDGMQLSGCYITAAARCAPPQNRPSRNELVACRPWLEAEIRLLREVRVVLVLGRVAWEAWLRAAGWWERLAPRERPPFRHGARATMLDGAILVCSFHPSRQNTQTGRLTRAMWHAVIEAAASL